MDRYKSFFRGIAYAGYCIVFLFAVYTFEKSIPDRIYVKAGEAIDYQFQVPVTMEIQEDSSPVAKSTNNANVRQSYIVTCRLFGIFPVKDIEVVLVDGDAVYAGGMPIGIYVKTRGVLVIGTSEVERPDGSEAAPAENILKAGDYILSVNGEKVAEKEDLQRLVQQNGAEKEILKINRKGEEVEVGVTPVQNKNGTYMLGAWVRDDLAGIGTLTYYKEDGTYGALGHAVSDGDVGERIQMREGYVYNAQIIGVKKGQKGNPGELSGMIRYQSADCLGTIEENTDIGIYGKQRWHSGLFQASHGHCNLQKKNRFPYVHIRYTLPRCLSDRQFPLRLARFHTSSSSTVIIHMVQIRMASERHRRMRRYDVPAPRNNRS